MNGWAGREEDVESDSVEVAGDRLVIPHPAQPLSGGQGSVGGVGPRIALVPRSFESFTRYVRRPTGRMTAYSETILSEAQLTDIYAFLRSLPPARPVSEIPLLEQFRKK